MSANKIYARVPKNVIKKRGLVDTTVLVVTDSTEASTTMPNRPIDVVGTRSMIGILRKDQNSSKSIGPRIIDPRKVDYNRIRDWLDFCDRRQRILRFYAFDTGIVS